jgi:hypothetical protein
MRGGPYIPTPIVYGDLLYVLQINGVLAAHDLQTGERVYQERVAAADPSAPLRSPPTASSI